MTESRNRDLATSIGAAVASDNIATDGSLAISGVTTYTNLSDLPSSGVNAGDLGFVTANNGLYIRGTSGWYVIALVNTSPTYTTSPASSYDLAKDGSTTTVITIVATDPEGFTITYSAIADSGFNGLAAVSQGTGNNTNVFTVTPKAQGVATTESGTLTFRATDGVNNTDVVSTFTLTFIINTDDSKHTLLLLKATGNNKQNTLVDGSTTGDTVNLNNNPRPSAFTPFHPMGYSRYFPYDNYGLVVTNDNSFTPTNKNFTIEAWIMLTGSQATNATIFSRGDSTSNREFALYLNDDTLGFKIWNSSDTEKSCTYTKTDLWLFNKWYHVAAELSGSVSSRTMNIYINGRRMATTTGVDASYVRDTNSSGRIGDANWVSNYAAFRGYMRDLRLSFDSSSSGQTPRYAGAEYFYVPTEPLTNDSTTQLLFFNGEGRPLDKSGNNLRASQRIQKTSTNNSSSYFVIKSPYDASPYDPSTHGTSWENYYDGSNAHFAKISHNSSVHEINTNDFCLEGWFYTDRFASGGGNPYGVMASKWSQGGWTLGYRASGPFGYISPNSGNYTTYGTSNDEIIELGQWNHLAVTYDNSATTIRTFVNGYLSQTITNAPATVRNTATTLFLGSYGSNSATYMHHGMISDLRLTVGSPRYTSAFTPPTEPFSNDSNTRVFVNSDLGIYNEKGASPDDDNKTNGTIINGDAKSSTTQKKNASSSMYFDGSSTGDSVKNFFTPLGTKNFTIEGWFYAGTQSSNARIFTTGGNNHAGGFSLVLRTDGNIQLQAPGGSSVYQSGSYADSAWHHFALVRGSTDTNHFHFYIDGTSVYNGTVSTDLTADYIDIGSDSGLSTSNYLFAGYLEDIRISEISRYPFIPSAETLTADSNTFLLACHAASATTVSGNWTVSVTSAPTVYDFGPANGMKSVYFGHNSNEIIKLTHTGSSSDYTMGDVDNGATDNFSVELWFYIDEDDLSGNNHITSNYGARDTSAAQFQIAFQSNNLRIRGHQATGSTYGGTGDKNITSVVHPRTWHHLYYVEEYIGSEFKFSSYIDGKLIQNGAYSSSTGYDLEQFPIGGRWDNVHPFYGYISNLRIQRGTVAHAIANNRFTAPTAELKG